MSFENERLLVVSAHAADFVWRAGGAIALYAASEGQSDALHGCPNAPLELLHRRSQTARHARRA